MKTLKQYVKQMNEDSLEYYVDSIDESIVEEGLFSGLKKLIKAGLSLTNRCFKKCGKATKDLIKKQMKNSKLKKLRGREWWDEWFAARDEFNEAWHKINPTDKDKKQEERQAKKEERKQDKNNKHQEEPENNEQEQQLDTNSLNNSQDQINEGNEEFNKTKVLFSEEKFVEYAKVEGMIDVIIAGFATLYDMSQDPEEENMDQKGKTELQRYVSANLNRIQKMLASGKIKGDDVKDDEVKNGAETIKQMIEDFNKAKEKNGSSNITINKETQQKAAEVSSKTNQIDSKVINSFVSKILA